MLSSLNKVATCHNHSIVTALLAIARRQVASFPFWVSLAGSSPLPRTATHSGKPVSGCDERTVAKLSLGLYA
jgi:hypothetical protein